jgi:hypothetical protein
MRVAVVSVGSGPYPPLSVRCASGVVLLEVCYASGDAHSSGEILRAVAAGETVQVTNNGQVAAVISPPPAIRWSD